MPKLESLLSVGTGKCLPACCEECGRLWEEKLSQFCFNYSTHYQSLQSFSFFVFTQAAWLFNNLKGFDGCAHRLDIRPYFPEFFCCDAVCLPASPLCNINGLQKCTRVISADGQTLVHIPDKRPHVTSVKHITGRKVSTGMSRWKEPGGRSLEKMPHLSQIQG